MDDGVAVDVLLAVVMADEERRHAPAGLPAGPAGNAILNPG